MMRMWYILVLLLATLYAVQAVTVSAKSTGRKLFEWQRRDPLFRHVMSQIGTKSLQKRALEASPLGPSEDAIAAVRSKIQAGWLPDVLEDPKPGMKGPDKNPDIAETGSRKAFSTVERNSATRGQRRMLNQSSRVSHPFLYSSERYELNEIAPGVPAFPDSSVVKVYFSASKGAQQLEETEFECSGALIDPYFVLTAAHCVYDVNTEKFFKSYVIIPGMNDFIDPDGVLMSEKPYGVAHSVNMFTFGYVQTFGDLQYDFGLIQLDRPMTFAGAMGDTTSIPSLGEEVTFSGYPAVDFDSRTLVKSTGNVIFDDSKLIREADSINCQGYSGANVFKTNCDDDCTYKTWGVISYNICPFVFPCCFPLSGIVAVTKSRRSAIEKIIETETRESLRPYVIWYFDPKDVSKSEAASVSPTFHSGGSLMFKLSVVNRGQKAADRFVVSFYYVPARVRLELLPDFRKDLDFIDSFVEESQLGPDDFVTVAGELPMPDEFQEGDEIKIIAFVSADDEYRKDFSAHFISMGTTAAKEALEATESPEPSVSEEPSASATPTVSLEPSPSNPPTPTEAPDLTLSSPNNYGNYLSSPDFEPSSLSWILQGEGEYSEDEKYSGERSVKLPNGNSSVAQYVVLESGWYVFECRYKGNGPVSLKATRGSEVLMRKQYLEVTDKFEPYSTVGELGVLGKYKFTVTVMSDSIGFVDFCSVKKTEEPARPKRIGGEFLLNRDFERQNHEWVRDKGSFASEAEPLNGRYSMVLPRGGARAYQLLLLEQGDRYVFGCYSKGSGPLMLIVSRVGGKNVAEGKGESCPVLEWTRTTVRFTVPRFGFYRMYVKAKKDDKIIVDQCSLKKV
ncbi:hypothetical protein NDN08_003989 [Rhodosorus marinus]|uniref:Peptidase S1 domain-containing protein n=1 Tax=Rhodosorus marinus TaxID=101924 RepID=A0AAV8UJN2_9RHOD|nr:hypothetical protein NDN08_003989 [Rhodosorus marinus]